MPNIGNLAAFAPVALFAALAFWRPGVIVFMLLAAISIITGCYAPDIVSGDGQTTYLGISVGLALIALSLFSIVMAFRYIFWEPDEV